MKTLLAFLAGAAILGAADVTEAVKKAEMSWAQAIVAQDYDALNKVLADDLSYAHSDGHRDTKASYIDSLKTGKQKYEKADPEDMAVKIYGNTAVLTEKLRLISETNGKKSEPTLSVLHVYVKRGEGWQLVAHQSARMP